MKTDDILNITCALLALIAACLQVWGSSIDEWAKTQRARHKHETGRLRLAVALYVAPIAAVAYCIDLLMHPGPVDSLELITGLLVASGVCMVFSSRFTAMVAWRLLQHLAEHERDS